MRSTALAESRLRFNEAKAFLGLRSWECEGNVSAGGISTFRFLLVPGSPCAVRCKNRGISSLPRGEHVVQGRSSEWTCTMNIVPPIVRQSRCCSARGILATLGAESRTPVSSAVSSAETDGTGMDGE